MSEESARSRAEDTDSTGQERIVWALLAVADELAEIHREVRALRKGR